MPSPAPPRDDPPPFWLSPRPFLEPDLPPVGNETERPHDNTPGPLAA